MNIHQHVGQTIEWLNTLNSSVLEYNNSIIELFDININNEYEILNDLNYKLSAVMFGPNPNQTAIDDLNRQITECRQNIDEINKKYKESQLNMIKDTLYFPTYDSIDTNCLLFFDADITTRIFINMWLCFPGKINQMNIH